MKVLGVVVGAVLVGVVVFVLVLRGEGDRVPWAREGVPVVVVEMAGSVTEAERREVVRAGEGASAETVVVERGDGGYAVALGDDDRDGAEALARRLRLLPGVASVVVGETT